MKRVLVVATSRKTRGGITSVIKAHERGEQWVGYGCKWIESHRDKGFLVILWYFIKSYILYLFYLPASAAVHIHLSEPVSAMRKCLFFLPARLLRKKVILHFHSFAPITTIKGKFAWVYRYLFKRADKVLVLSEMWKREVCDAFGLDNVTILYNPSLVSVGDKLWAKQKNILFAGAVNARKGYADLVRAFAAIAVRFPDWKLVFAGNGEVEAGKRLAEELGIGAQCEFLGWVDSDRKDRAFKEASIFCLPSYAEGFPMALLDAWAYGLPAIVTPVGGIPDVAVDGKNVLLFNPGDVESLSLCLRRLIEDDLLRENLAKESISFASGMFSVDEVNRCLGKIYREVIGF